jgi:hypothetical protein
MPGAFMASLLTVIILHLLPGLSRDASNFLLLSIRIIVAAACHSYVQYCLEPTSISTLPSPLSALNNGGQWHSDVRTAMKEFRLDPDLIHYASCKKCFSLSRKVDGKYPSVCAFKETPGSDRCGTKLVANAPDADEPTPLCTFAYQPIKSYIARLLSRPGIAEHMTKATAGWNKKASRCWDFFGAETLRTFCGPDGKTPYLEAPAGEIRLVFSLFVDYFNPLGNKAAGKHLSVGGIYMVCLNLPVHLRYRVENIYIVGVVPGEPHLHHVNHLLQPLVSDLLQLWKTGVWFSRTSFHQLGCLVRAALIPFIADAPAARKTAGFPGITALHFCNFCTQTSAQIADFDIRMWSPISRDTHTAAALRWKNAPDHAARESEWKTNHVRWSELLRLPYWDVTKFVVVDPMHNLFLNVIPHHVRDFWGVHEKEIHGRKGVKPHSPEQQTVLIHEAHSALLGKNASKLRTIRRTYLEVLAKENNVKLEPRQMKNVPSLVSALLAWVSTPFISERLHFIEKV